MPSVSLFGAAPRVTNIVLREQFTGDGSDTTFQLTSSPGNCTFNKGTWAASNVQTAYPAHVTGTDKKPTYDSVVPVVRNRIGVSSIDASGLVTLDYAPRNGVNFYVWYWYQLQPIDEIDTYREDFVASMEAEAAAYGDQIVLDVSNFDGILSATDTTVQTALETIDDVAHADLSGLDSDDHTQYILEDGTRPFSAYIDIDESSIPGTPTANVMRLYAESIQGFPFLSFKDDGGMVRKFVRDSVMLGYNDSGSTIAAARIVYASGSYSSFPTIALAKADSAATMPAIGVTIESISNNTFGRIMQVGLLEDVNTLAYNSGDIFYVSATTAGVPTTTAPIYPNIRQEIGTVLVDSATIGSIQIVARSAFSDAVIDHSGLLNLDSDDHTQYALVDGTRDFTGSINLDTVGTDEYKIGGNRAIAMPVDNTNLALGPGAGGSLTTGQKHVLIGTNAGGSATDEDGNIAIGYNAMANSASAGNIAIGEDSLRQITGVLNIGIGIDTLYDATSAQYNIAMGYRSMFNVTTGDYNVALGALSLFTSTTAHYNVAIGYKALEGSTSQGNVAIGYRAADATTTGENQVAIGYQALLANTIGAKNVAIGADALLSNSEGGQNIAIGHSALYGNTTGVINLGVGFESGYHSGDSDYNLAIGYRALYGVSGQTHHYNAAVGYYALYAITTGSYNFGLGYETLRNLTSGGYNIAIGFESGHNITTGSRNISIGYQISTSGATVDDELNIGNVIYGDLSANSNVTINAATVSVNYDLMLAGDGVLGLKETTTPTADTNYGKVYTKNDNNLYFQDGAGVEHTIGGNRIIVGDGTGVLGTDPVITIDRTTSTASANAHGIEDQTVFQKAGSYASFDCRIEVPDGSGDNYAGEHIVGFQSYPVYNNTDGELGDTAGHLDGLNGFLAIPGTGAGTTVDRVKFLNINDMNLNGTVDNAYGIYVHSGGLSAATNNWLIYSDDVNAKSYMKGRIGIGAVPLSNECDIGLFENGILALKETTTPTADANYGKVYTKNDNKIYFQDGAGTEHEIAFV